MRPGKGRVARLPEQPTGSSTPLAGHPQTPLVAWPRCLAKTPSVAGACNQSWGHDSAIKVASQG